MKKLPGFGGSGAAAVMMEVFSFVMGAAFLKLQARRTLSKGWRCSDMVGRPGMISV